MDEDPSFKSTQIFRSEGTILNTGVHLCQFCSWILQCISVILSYLKMQSAISLSVQTSEIQANAA